MTWREMISKLSEDELDQEIVALNADTDDLVRCRFSELPQFEAREFGLETANELYPILIFDSRDFYV